MPNDPGNKLERATAKEEFVRSFARAPGQRRILLTGAVSVVTVLVLAGTGRSWLVATTAICFLLLFTLERMMYVTLISKRDEELKHLRETDV